MPRPRRAAHDAGDAGGSVARQRKSASGQRALRGRICHRYHHRSRCVGMKTLLVVSGDEALRNRLERMLDHTTLFMATSDGEALKTLSLIDVDAVLRHSPTGTVGLDTFVARVKERAPHAGIIVAGAVEY